MPISNVGCTSDAIRANHSESVDVKPDRPSFSRSRGDSTVPDRKFGSTGESTFSRRRTHENQDANRRAAPPVDGAGAEGWAGYLRPKAAFLGGVVGAGAGAFGGYMLGERFGPNAKQSVTETNLITGSTRRYDETGGESARWGATAGGFFTGGAAGAILFGAFGHGVGTAVDWCAGTGAYAPAPAPEMVQMRQIPPVFSIV